jgi:NAD(P)-dependent dehydrogenase (short-subunit alcohol dehydrogenase family)
MRLQDRVAIVTGAGSASDDAAMITGSCIEVDGGRCI